MKTCEYCGKEMIKKSNRFCSISCHQNHRSEESKERLKNLYIDKGFLDDCVRMTLKEVAQKFNISLNKAARITRTFGFNKQKASKELTIKRNTEILEKYREGRSLQQLRNDYRLSTYQLKRILAGHLRETTEMDLIKLAPSGCGWDVDVTVSPHKPKYSSYTTNGMWR